MHSRLLVLFSIVGLLGFITFFIQGAEYAHPDVSKTTVCILGFEIAVESGNCELVVSILNNGMSSNQLVIDAITYQKVPILWKAIVSRQVEMAELLINKGAIVNFQRFGRELSQVETPLHRAVLLSDSDMVELLLKSGADASARDGLGYTPLELAKVLAPDIISLDQIYHNAIILAFLE